MKKIRWIDSKVHVLFVVVLLLGVITGAESSQEKKAMMIKKSSPILHVKDVEPSVKFWTERFGFRVTIQVPEGEQIGFAAIDNGSVELMYQTYSGMKDAGPLSAAVTEGPSFLFMEVPDIYAIKKVLHPAEIVHDVHKTPYGANEIIVREPGGHYVIFSQLPSETK